MSAATAKIAVLVVDDEAPAVDELRYLLERDEAVGSVRVAHSARAALELLSTNRFDGIFLDIEMPDTTGLDLARALTSAPESVHRPFVVFVTAFERHAVEAFEVDAVDYVLKPVRPERLAQAVRRIQAAAGPIDDEPASGSTYGSRFGVDVGGKTVFIDRSSVIAVEASRDYVRLHTIDKTYLLRTPISVLEAAWSGVGFVRVHRSFLVAVDHVRELRTDDSGTVLAVGGLEIPVSRTYSRDLKQRLVSANRQVQSPRERPVGERPR